MGKLAKPAHRHKWWDVVHVFDRGDPPWPWWKEVLWRVRRVATHVFVSWPTVLWWRIRYGILEVLARRRLNKALARADRIIAKIASEKSSPGATNDA